MVFQRGHKINAGRKYTDERNKNVSLSKLGEKNPAWRGNKVGYKPLHQWIRKWKAQPEVCTFCRKSRKLELANISKKYKREIEDWLWLCRSCHRKYDGRMPPSWQGKKHSKITIQKLKIIAKNRQRNEKGIFI